MQPNPTEQTLADVLGAPALNPVSGAERPIAAYLSTEDPGQQDQELPGFATGASNEQTSRGEQPDTPDADSNEGGAAAGGESGPPAHPHIASIGSVRGGGTRRRGQAS